MCDGIAAEVAHASLESAAKKSLAWLQVGANRWEYDYAKLEGAFRELAAPDPSQYDEQAYSEALTESLDATKRFVMHTA